MQRSDDRILTTHTGSLPRPRDLVESLRARDQGQPYDEAALQARIPEAVAEVVRKQLETGLDVINDGEMGRIGFAAYVTDRLDGFGGQSQRPRPADMRAFPEYARQAAQADDATWQILTPTCIGPVSHREPRAPRRDAEILQAAVKGLQPTEVFMTAPSAGIVVSFFDNRYYPTREAYLYAVADAMRTEYRAVYEAGFVLQIDAPDLGLCRHLEFADKSTEEFQAWATLCIEALNHALQDIPPDQVRLHVCWGNSESPHVFDIPLKDLIGILLKANVGALSIEASNPRHAHEWKLFREVKLPDGMLLIPGVIDTTTNFVEHPELVAQRIVQYAELVGRENVLAGTDCGFGTAAGRTRVEASVSWAKLGSLVEGARLASQQLWG
jgi:5-methyltetrahydropteroyltriglutamate--homocysteine methyltransferase